MIKLFTLNEDDSREYHATEEPRLLRDVLAERFTLSFKAYIVEMLEVARNKGLEGVDLDTFISTVMENPAFQAAVRHWTVERQLARGVDVPKVRAGDFND
jgi:hypothetical protein